MSWRTFQLKTSLELVNRIWFQHPTFISYLNLF